MRNSIALAMALAVLGCARDTAPQSNAASYETVATGLIVPWAMAFAPDGRMFVTERQGRIRIIRDGRLEPEPWAKLNVVSSGESGLMGIALSPDFATDGRVYVVATFVWNDHLINRVLRFTEKDGRPGEPEVLVDDIPAAEFHAGDAIAFGPDGMLYVATGDAGEPEAGQDRESLAAKILRFTPDGGIPSDNPFPGSPVYALGVRNVQGLAWSADGQLFATDHGPSGFPSERLRRNHDELNAITAGRNYGWPVHAGYSDDDAYVSPLTDWSPALAPSGLAVLDNYAYVGALRGRQLRRVQLERSEAARSGWRAVHEEVLFKDELGRIRAVALGPDGYIYFSTSNWDGRGDPADNDDRILRLKLK
jgi:glucose/arabinose dehydrogenase